MVSKSSKKTLDADNDPTAFFRSSHEGFEGAAERVGGAIDFFYDIAGHNIHLRFAGSSLIPKITPAFAHLATPPCPSPALTVCIWDSASTGKSMPSPPWSWNAYSARGEISGYNNERIHTSFQADVCALNMLDSKLNLGLFWIRDASRLPYNETGAPLRLILHWWLSKQGQHFAHAAALGTPSGGVLLVGQGGSGKSTSSLTCLYSNLAFSSDDYCLFTHAPVPYAHSIYSTAKVDRQMLRRLPHLVPEMDKADRLVDEKALFFLWECFSHKMIKGFPIRALLLPRVMGRLDTTIRPASPLESIRALAPSTLLQLPGADRTSFKAITTLAKLVPSYHLELGSNLSKIPKVITDLLERMEVV